PEAEKPALRAPADRAPRSRRARPAAPVPHRAPPAPLDPEILRAGLAGPPAALRPTHRGTGLDPPLHEAPAPRPRPRASTAPGRARAHPGRRAPPELLRSLRSPVDARARRP